MEDGHNLTEKISSIEDEIRDYEANARSFQKIIYIGASALITFGGWILASMQGLETDRTRNATRIENLQKELSEFKIYMDGRRQGNEVSGARQDAEISALQVEFSRLEAQVAIHNQIDQQERDKMMDKIKKQ